MIKNNYDKLLEDLLLRIKNEIKKPTLLLHCCCAPCSSYVFEYLLPYFNITALFYNPNIFPDNEYTFRLEELRRLIKEMGVDSEIDLMEVPQEKYKFEEISSGLENYPEGSERCLKCYNLRLLKTAIIAKSLNFDYFTTTLTISPYKDANKINEIGKNLSLIYGINYLFSDFKKRDGYKRSIELSRKYKLYRQNYCGCRYSQRT